MFSTGPSYSKLKTNLRLTINRLKLLEKKKTELAQKARREIADYISQGKEDRARIRVEHIVREDYLVEGMELLEMYCDLLLARFGLIQSQKEVDPGLEESIASIIWSTPRLQAEVPELRSCAEQLKIKYSKEYAEACLSNKLGTVSEKLQHKLSVHAPPKVLVERYMIEIAKIYNVQFEPDPTVMNPCDDILAAELIDFDSKQNPGNSSGGGGGGGGGIAMPSVPIHQPSSVMQPQPPPQQPHSQPAPNPFNYPPTDQNYPQKPVVYNEYTPLPGQSQHPSASAPFNSMQNAQPPPLPPTNPVGGNMGAGSAPMGYPGSGPPVIGYPGGHPSNFPPAYSENGYNPQPNDGGAGPLPSKNNLDLPELPDFPAIPAGTPKRSQSPNPGGNSTSGAGGGGDDEIDFDDLTRRFEELKKKK